MNNQNFKKTVRSNASAERDPSGSTFCLYMQAEDRLQQITTTDAECCSQKQKSHRRK